MTHAVVHVTIPLDSLDLRLGEGDLEQRIIQDAGFKDFQPSSVAVEFIEGRAVA